MTTASRPPPPEVSGMEIDITVIRGTGLVAKDRHLITRKRTSSDPYVKIFWGGDKSKCIGRTSTRRKTLDPRWDESFKVHLGASDASSVLRSSSSSSSPSGAASDPRCAFELRVYDEDRASGDDPMGVAIVPLPLREPPRASWVDVGAGERGREGYCRKASGRLEVLISASARRVLSLVRGNAIPIPPGRTLRVGLGWEMERGEAVDLDASCVAVGRTGDVLMDETAYYANLANPNGSVRHSGDEREGDEDIGGTGDDEVITADLGRVPYRVLALYFVLTVATVGKTLEDVRSATVRVTDEAAGVALCRFAPSLSGPHTALFLMRLARASDSDDGGRGAGGGRWALSIIEDTDRTARDFGSLMPEIKGYTRDLVPGVRIDPNERVAVMRKGGTIRLRDYSPNRRDVPDVVVMGLAWDVTRGVNIDLDASAICLDSDLNLVDLVYFKQLTSRDGSIRHSGDEREGDEVGDDEKISVHLRAVNPRVKYVGFVVNSYSGQELDDVASASCHLFDPHTGRDVARYGLSNCRELDGHTALVMACLYRDDTYGGHGGGGCGSSSSSSSSSSDDEDDDRVGDTWLLRIISEAAQGRVAHELVDELQAFLLRSAYAAPTIPPEPEIVLTQMPETVPLFDQEIAVGPIGGGGGGAAEEEIAVGPVAPTGGVPGRGSGGRGGEDEEIVFDPTAPIPVYRMANLSVGGSGGGRGGRR